MMKTLRRKSGARYGVALATVLLGGCSLTTMFDPEKPELRGRIDFNGTLGSADATALYEKGKAHFAAGQLGLASDEFQAALAKKPGSIEILNALGATYDRLGRFDLADRYYHDAIAIDSKDPQTLNNLAYSLMLRGDPQHAIPLLNVAQSGSAADPMIAANLALAKRLEKKLDQPTAAELGPNHQEHGSAPGQVAAAGSAKSLWIERRTERVQELVFAKAGAKTPAQEWNLGSATLIIPLPPAPKAGERGASTAVPEGSAQAIAATYHSSSSRDDTDTPIAAPLTPVSQSELVELKPVPGADDDKLVKIREHSAGAPLRTVQSPPAVVARDDATEPGLKPLGTPPSSGRSESKLAEMAALPIPAAPERTAKYEASRTEIKPPRQSGACTIEISNGAGKPGMAARFRALVERHGLKVRRLTNDRSFSNSKSVAFYKPGCESGARRLAALLSLTIAREPAPAERSDVRLRLGRDLVGFYQSLVKRPAGRTAL